MKKLCNIVMLPTEEITKIVLPNPNNQLPLDVTFECKYAHLYITSNEEIKEGDWFLDRSNELFQCDKDILKINIKIRKKWYKKIIATTDKSIKGDPERLYNIKTGDLKYTVEFPQIPESLIKAYVESKGELKNIFVEYRDSSVASYDAGLEYSLKIHSDDTIIWSF